MFNLKNNNSTSVGKRSLIKFRGNLNNNNNFENTSRKYNLYKTKNIMRSSTMFYNYSVI